jgi:phosphatidylserine decarboxylase
MTGRASAGWRATIGLLKRVPQGALSRAAGRLADLPLARPLRRPLLGTFARLAGVDVSEAEHSLELYDTVNRFFVRRLRSNAREWPGDPDVVTSPVDAILGQTGVTCDGALLQAKGRTYSAVELLGDAADAAVFEGGPFLTLYLSPRHYHRIHTPCAGRVVRARHLPGALLPVNAAAVLTVPHVFPRNERLVCLLECAAGRVAVVAIGATNVGRISTAFDPGWGGWVTNRKGATVETRDYAPPREVAAGAELMAFHVGSSLVMLLEPGTAALRGELRPGVEVRVGQPLLRSD